MASNRHLGRIVALQSLYEYEFRDDLKDTDETLNSVIKRNLERYKKDIDDTSFVEKLVNGVVEHRDELDKDIQPIAPDWPLDQVARIDRNILRVGMYELLHCQDDIPARVAINESVELAKSFGSDNSSKFINGVLGTAYRKLVKGEPDDKAAEV